MSATEEDGEEDSHGGSWRGRHGEEDISHGGKRERKTSAMEEDISDDQPWRKTSDDGGWRGRHQQ